MATEETSVRSLPDRTAIRAGDYVSPDLEMVRLDDAFPEMVIGAREASDWPYLRREVDHNWYVDRRNPTVGFLSRDEVAIVYNSARHFQGMPCLEIGCWRGWSTAHFALGSGGLEVIDPALQDPVFRDDVLKSLGRAGVRDRVVLHAGSSPEEIERISAVVGRRWSMVLIDGDHEGDAPLADAEAIERYAADDALVLFHDLVSPKVAAGLEYLRQRGWQTSIYQTMQIIGVAVRGAARPIPHVPDPDQVWTLPPHLASFSMVGESRWPRLVRVAELPVGRVTTESSASGSDTINLPQGNVATSLESALEVPGRSHDGVREKPQSTRRGLPETLKEVESEGPQVEEFERLRLAHLSLVAKLGASESKLIKLEELLAAGQQAREPDETGVSAKFAEQDRLGQWGSATSETQFSLIGNRPSPNGPEGYTGIRRFAFWMARKRTLFGLVRRLLTGRRTEVRSILDQSMRMYGVPAPVADASIGWLSSSRAIIGLSWRRALAGMDATQGLLIVLLDRDVVATSNQMQETSIDLKLQLEMEKQRFRALEAVKIEDEKALLQARILIAKLRGPVTAPAA